MRLNVNGEDEDDWCDGNESSHSNGPGSIAAESTFRSGSDEKGKYSIGWDGIKSNQIYLDSSFACHFLFIEW